MILGIDPSFTRTGLAVMDDNGKICFTENISAGESVYESVLTMHLGAERIIDRITQVIDEELHLDNIDVIVEYPALATPSGAYLAVLHGMLAHSLYDNGRVSSVTWVPPNACDSWTKNKSHSKTYLVNFCRERDWISEKRVSHDICTAIIFCHLLECIKAGKYKNKYFSRTVGN